MTHRPCAVRAAVAIVGEMMRHRAKTATNDWDEDPAADDRRAGVERRRRLWWSMLYGSFRPRRRSLARRGDDSRLHMVDWHAAPLLAAAIGILVLSMTDAFMTVTLLANGAIEVNPIMANMIYRSVALFAAVKMTLTGASVVFLVVLAHYRFLRRVRVEWAIYGVLLGYGSLIAYEIWLMGGFAALPFF